MPSEASTTYARYKAGTQKLLRWLKSHAHSQSLTGTSSPCKTSKATSSKVNTNELVPWARSLALAKIEIPLEIIYITKDVISGRRDCLSWYEELARSSDVDPEVLTSNRTHKHFLSQLRAVHDILLDTYQARQPKTQSFASKLDAELEKTKNSFRYLSFEDPTESNVAEATDVNSGSGSEPTQKVAQRPIDYALDDGKEEKSFAIFCLFRDFADLRRQTCNLWLEYKRGDLSFLTVCFLTNTAFQLHSSAAEDFTKSYPDLKSFECILEFSGLVDYLLQARTAQYYAYNQASEDLTCISDLRDDALCMNAWGALRDFKDISPWLQTTDAERKRVGSPRVRFPGHRFNKALLCTGTDLVDSVSDAMSSPVTAVSNMDVFTLQLVRYMSQPDKDAMPIGLVGMTSIYIGIYDVLQDDVEQGLMETERAFNRVHEAAAAFRHFFRAGEDRLPFAPIDDVLACTRKLENHWEFRNCSSADQTGVKFSRRLLGTFPVLGGMHAVKLRQQSHIMSLFYCNSDATLLTLAHLYKASKEQGLLTMSWPSVDYFIANQKKVKQVDRKIKAFCGDISPSNQTPALSRARQYLMSLGMSLEQAYRATPMDHPEVPSISLATRPSSTSHLLVASEHMAMRAKNLGVAPNMDELHYDIVRRLMKSGQPFEDPIIVEAWQRSKSLTHTQMLVVLQHAMVVSEQDVNTNYLGLFQACGSIMGDLIDWASLKGTVDMSTLESPTSIGAFTLWQAAQYEQTVYQQRAPQRRNLFLRKVAQLISSYMGTDKDELFESSRQVSSGSIAESLKPSNLYPSGRPKQFAVTDLGGITFEKPVTYDTPAEKQSALDLAQEKLAGVAEQFEREQSSLESAHDTGEKLQELEDAVQAEMYRSHCFSKAVVTFVDRKVVFEARDFTNAEQCAIISQLPTAKIVDALKRGVKFAPGRPSNQGGGFETMMTAQRKMEGREQSANLTIG